jgi:hypothetical protein
MMVSNVNAGGEGWPWVDQFVESFPEGGQDRIVGNKQSAAAPAAAGSTTTVGIDQSLGLAPADWGGAKVFTGNLPTVSYLCLCLRPRYWLCSH